MGFTSTIPLKFEARVFRARISLPKTLAITPYPRHVSFFTSQSSVGRHFYGSCLSQMQCLRCTEKDDSLVTEEMLEMNPQSHDKAKNAERAVTDLSSGGKQDLSTDRAYAIRNVVLWVSAAATFGIALGLMEGFEKASEYFAGWKKIMRHLLFIYE